jgi:adenylylsulfate kinase
MSWILIPSLIVAVIWIFGLPSAGKSTLAAGLAKSLREQRRSCLVLDGDELRGGLCQGLGFTEADRSENLRRAAEVALLAARSEISVIVAMITPLAAHREMITKILRHVLLQWVWADCPAETCRSRDVKGLYQKQQAGELEGLTGADAGFEAPGTEVFRLDTLRLNVAESVQILLDIALEPLEPKVQNPI